MEALINSLFIVAIAEMGDKTQLLALVLVCKFKKPWTILGGILTATIFNHALAASLGGLLSTRVPEFYLKGILALSFFAFAIWVLIPDKDDGLSAYTKHGVFLTTVIAFFIAEMGDKTQLATTALAAQYNQITMVTIGTTAGMLLANGLPLFYGEKIIKKIPMKYIHRFASAMFIIMGIAILVKK